MTVPPLTVVGAHWRPMAFLTFNVVALLLLASWLCPIGHDWWQQWDISLFTLLNGSLHQSIWWDWLWALTSVRVFDVLSGLLMLGLLIRTDWGFRAHQVYEACLTFIALLVILLIIRVLFSQLVEHMEWQHSSPSLQIEQAIRLSKDFPILSEWLDLKDQSNRSFPGDHASILLLWGLFVAYYAQGLKRFLTLALCLFFMLPRLIAGAHWFSDDFVGGLFIALLSFGWGYCTPLGAYLTQGLAWSIRPLFRVLSRLPFVRTLAILRQPHNS